MSAPVSVILIRDNAEQLTGSGCCGKLEGDSEVLGGKDVFQHTRRQQQDLGVLHRAVKEFFPPLDGKEQVTVVVVDPRNQLYLTPKLWRDVFRFRPGWVSGLRTAFQLFSLPAVVVNGEVISSRGAPPHPDAFCHFIAERLNCESEVDKPAPW